MIDVHRLEVLGAFLYKFPILHNLVNCVTVGEVKDSKIVHSTNDK